MFLARAVQLLALALLFASTAPAQAQTPWSASDRLAARTALGAEAATLSDAQLDAAVVAYARTELGQRIRPGEIDRLWAISPPPRDVPAELAAARAGGRLGAWLAALPPPDPAYRRLQAAAARYRRLTAAGGWRRLPAGRMLALGATGPEVAALRARLAMEGYGASAGAPQEFDAGLAAQLALYQGDRSLPRSGKLDAATRGHGHDGVGAACDDRGQP